MKKIVGNILPTVFWIQSRLHFVAVLIGVILGSIVAIIRTAYDKNHEIMKDGFKKTLLKIGNTICVLYTTVIRGTPVMIQIMIMFFVIFSNSRNGVPIAMLTFGINSRAYVAEIIRGGIMSIDIG